MDHGPAVKLGKDFASPAKAKLGIYLFFVYSLIYSGFVAIAIISPKTMGVSTILGLNLACFYGFGLIVLAIIMGLIYNHICTGLETKLNQPEAADAEPQSQESPEQETRELSKEELGSSQESPKEEAEEKAVEKTDEESKGEEKE